MGLGWWVGLSLTASHGVTLTCVSKGGDVTANYLLVYRLTRWKSRALPTHPPSAPSNTHTTNQTPVKPPLLPDNSLRVVPDFPWGPRVAVVAARVGATVQEAGIESKSACFVVSFPFVGVSVRQAPPQRRDPAALLLLAPNTQAASARDSVVVVAIAFQWYKVPLLR